MKNEKFPLAQQRLVMDYAASILERVLLLSEPAEGIFAPVYLKRIKSAIKLLRHPPTKPSRRAKG